MEERKACARISLRTSNGCEVASTSAANKAGASWNVTSLGIKVRAFQRDDAEPDEGKINLVRKLRLLFQQSLLKPRCNWDGICIQVAAGLNVTLGDYATAFFHGLELYGVRRFQPFVSRSAEASFDESWLVQIVRQLQAGNIENAYYLIATRVRPAGRRRLLLLAQGLAAGLTRT